MPDKASWIEKIPDALAVLEVADAPLERAAVEQLLEIKRSQAVKLMQVAGGKVTGKYLTIEPELLSRYLWTQVDPKVMKAEKERRRRLGEKLSEIRQQFVEQPPCHVEMVPERAAQTYRARLDRLPKGVELVEGELHISFTNGQDLLEKLVALSQAIGKDMALFLASVITQNRPLMIT